MDGNYKSYLISSSEIIREYAEDAKKDKIMGSSVQLTILKIMGSSVQLTILNSPT